MPEIVIELLKQVNVIQLLAIGIMFWFFYSRLDGKITDSKKELKEEIKILAIKVEDIDRRLCRIEGSLSTHGHCLFNQEKPEKRAE